MNKLLIPSSPNWFETDILACSPDNTLIYGARQDIVVIKPTSENEPDNVQVIIKAHSMRIKSVNINRNWGQPHKYAVTASEDKIVKLWDIETLEKKLSHNKHISHDDNTKVVSALFAGEDKVVSVSETGTVIIWNIIKNETKILDSLFDAKAIVTCMSVCPHATWLAGVGLKNGLIVVIDLRRTGKIIYKLRGHEKAIVSLSWCPAPVNIFPVKPNNKVVEKKLEGDNEEIKIDNGKATKAIDNGELVQKEKGVEVTDSSVKDNSTVEPAESGREASESAELKKTSRRKQKNPKKAPNPWVGLTYVDDEPNGLVLEAKQESDFLKTCEDLKQKILQRKVKETSATQESRVTLKPKFKNQKCTLSNLLLKKEQASNVVEGTIENDPVEKSNTILPETSEKEIETPTDTKEISMEISHSVEKLDTKLTDINTESTETIIETSSNIGDKGMGISRSVGKLDTKLTDMSVKSMEVTVCGKDRSTNTVDTPLSDVDGKEECLYVSASSDDKESFFDSSRLDTTGSSEESKKFSSVSSCDNDANCSKRHSDIFEKELVRKSDTSGTSESGDVFHDAQICGTKGGKGDIINAVEQSTYSEEQPRKEYLLASSAREPNIYIWRAGTDGRMQTFLIVPPSKNQKKTRPDKLWITICWVAPTILLSSSRSAELLQWTLPRQILQTQYVRQIHKDHWSVLFSIKAPILYLDEYNFLQKRDINAWTTGMDRTILNTDIESQKNLVCYPALGGSVNCLTGSPIDSNRLAFGTGEGTVNVWDLSREHKKRIVFSTFYQKIVGSVTSLAWHPIIETSLAWGTVEGRIGIIDTGGKGKPSKILPQYFKTEIFKIEWGPLNGDLRNPGLFVVSEANVAVFDPKSQEQEPQLLELPDNTSVYTMSWKPDYSILLVSSKTGSLITYTPDLKISNVSYVRLKLQSIIWNPNAVSDDMSVSKYCRTFVSIVKNVEFAVYDLGVRSDNYDDKVIARFENRNTIINSIEWNPYSGNQLVFADAEGVAQVYDIETKTVLSTYVNPYLDAFLSVYWSPIDQDYIIVGTLAHKIIVWNVSECAPWTHAEINSRRNKLMKVQHKTVNDPLSKAQTEQSSAKETEESTPKKSTKSQILPMFYGRKEKAMIADFKKLLQWKLGDKSVESNIGDGKHIDVLDVFADEGNMERILNVNISLFKQQGKHYNENLLTLFKGDIGAAVKEAIDRKRVNPWIISMCPMVSPKLWQTACETYARQLLDEPEADALEIVTYLLACHKVEESIDVLCERAMFREAFVLAKARFGTDNTIVSEVLNKWARNMVYQGNFELAAQCYISMGKFEDAASVLFRRSNVELLELAVELAKLSGNEELQKAVTFRFNAFKTAVDDTKESHKPKEETSKESGKETSEDLREEVLPAKNDSSNVTDESDAKIRIFDNSNGDSIDALKTGTDIGTSKNGELDDSEEFLSKDKNDHLKCERRPLCAFGTIIQGENNDGEKTDTGMESKVLNLLEQKEQKSGDKKKEAEECKYPEDKDSVNPNVNNKDREERTLESKTEDVPEEKLDNTEARSGESKEIEQGNVEFPNKDKKELLFDALKEKEDGLVKVAQEETEEICVSANGKEKSLGSRCEDSKKVPKEELDDNTKDRSDEKLPEAKSTSERKEVENGIAEFSKRDQEALLSESLKETDELVKVVQETLETEERLWLTNKEELGNTSEDSNKVSKEDDTENRSNELVTEAKSVNEAKETDVELPKKGKEELLSSPLKEKENEIIHVAKEALEAEERFLITNEEEVGNTCEDSNKVSKEDDTENRTNELLLEVKSVNEPKETDVESPKKGREELPSSPLKEKENDLVHVAKEALEPEERFLTTNEEELGNTCEDSNKVPKEDDTENRTNDLLLEAKSVNEPKETVVESPKKGREVLPSSPLKEKENDLVHVAKEALEPEERFLTINEEELGNTCKDSNKVPKKDDTKNRTNELLLKAKSGNEPKETDVEYPKKGKEELLSGPLKEKENELVKVAKEALEPEERFLTTNEEEKPEGIRYEDSDKEHGKKVEELGDKLEDRSTSESDNTERCPLDLSKEIEELLPALLKENAGAQKVLELHTNLLSTDEVKELLSKRKINSEEDGCVKEDEKE